MRLGRTATSSTHAAHGDGIRKGGRLHQVTLGSSGIITSALGFGTAGLLRIGSARRRQDVLAAGFSAGITHFDTAPIYGLGESERALGRLLRGRRDRVTVTTKFGLQMSRAAARLSIMQRPARALVAMFPRLRRSAARSTAVLYSRPDYGVQSVRASLERSLRALGTDYVDLYLAHECSVDALPNEELIELLEGLRRAGTIRAFGTATTFEHTQAVRAARPSLAQVVQFESDLFDRNVARLGGTPHCACITQGALARAVPRLRALTAARSDLAESWSAQVGVDLRSDAVLSALALRAAVLANIGGVVLMQSTSAHHVLVNAQTANRSAHDAAVMRLSELVAAEAGA
jgi:aryl-alcohol dehydrogenase-like predicted oxidoreductase